VFMPTALAQLCIKRNVGLPELAQLWYWSSGIIVHTLLHIMCMLPLCPQQQHMFESNVVFIVLLSKKDYYCFTEMSDSWSFMIKWVKWIFIHHTNEDSILQGGNLQKFVIPESN
jgi:hypothetical protein